MQKISPQSESGVDQYIKIFPKDTQKMLEEIRGHILECAPEAIETINYGIPTFKLNGKNLVHFGGYKTHIGFYPGAEAIEVFKKDLEEYKTLKGTIQFLLDKPLPLGLIKRIVKFRVGQIC